MKMKQAGLCIALVAGLWAGHSSLALADPAYEHPDRPYQAMQGDWQKRTQERLDQLKTRLVLTPDQQSAWDAWSSGVMNDVHNQTEKIRAYRDERPNPTASNLSTPDKMAWRAQRLKEHIARMQDHLARVEAAEQRTRTFYGQLDSKQKSIFDLFWERDFRSHGWGHHGGKGCEPRGHRPE
jgi:hypothetical protein